MVMRCVLAAVAVVAFAPVIEGADEELARGIKLVEQGEYSQAILVLDAAAQRLDKKGAKADAARAYFYLGSAYVGENQEMLSLASFRRALDRDERLELSAFDVSPKVREAFEKARRERNQEKVATSKKGGSKAPWIILAVLGTAGGAAAALGGSGGGGGGGGPVDGGGGEPNPPSVFVPPGGRCSGTFDTQTTFGFPPAPDGSTIRLSENRIANITFSVNLPCIAPAASVEVALVENPTRGCFFAESAPVSFPTPGLTVTGIVVAIPLTAANNRCGVPVIITQMQVRVKDAVGTLVTVRTAPLSFRVEP
jgi:hypothetical protein